MSTMAYVDIDGIKIRCTVAGVGEQILLLHGWGGSLESMRVVFDDFARHYAVCALDLPGHGESGLPPIAWGVSDYSEMVLRLMDVLGFQCPHIIAHSFGAWVTLRLAMAHPERVGKLILANSSGVKSPRTLRYYMRVLVARIGKYLARHCGRWGEAARHLLYRAVASRDYAAAGPLRDTFVKIVHEDITPLLSYVKSPTLLIWGADDKDTPVSSARVMERLIPNAKLVILRNAGHFSYLDQYGQFRLIVSRFLRD